MRNYFVGSIFVMFIVAVSCLPLTYAQTTEFVYQGNLRDTGLPATGTYDFEFRLYDALTLGNQVGVMVPQNNIAVTNGVFSVNLDFGSEFPGAQRFLEVSVRPDGPGSFTLLTPRMRVASAPYAIKTLSADTATTAANATNAITAANANALGGLTANGFIQNTTSPQASSNFFISGTGRANAFNSTTDYQIFGLRVLGAPGNNTFTGFNTGTATTSGDQNSFFGFSAGAVNTTGTNNTFVGVSAGNANTIGGNNSAFGRIAGLNTTTGSYNTFLGAESGTSNTTGSSNIYIGSFTSGTPAMTNSVVIGVGASASTDNTVVLGTGAHTVQVPGSLNVTGTFTGTLPTGSPNYIQNTLTQQASSNFNISGNGTVGGTLSAGTVNTSTTYNILGFKLLGGDMNGNLGLGVNGILNASVTGGENLAVGHDTGASLTSGEDNSFFGNGSGEMTSTGSANSFFGKSAGQSNVGGSDNAFFGFEAGKMNLSGTDNSFFGRNSGQSNTTGIQNSFFGRNSGGSNNGGNDNSFFGYGAGQFNDTGDENTFVGKFAGNSNTSGNQNVFLGGGAAISNAVGSRNTVVGYSAGNSINNPFSPADNNTLIGYQANVNAAGLDFATAIGSGAIAMSSNSVTLGRASDTVIIPNTISLASNPVVTGTVVCRDSTTGILGTGSCSNAFNEPTTRIEQQQKQIEELQQQVEALKKLICAKNGSAEACQNRKP
jgi:hypothetical protein